MRTTSLRPDAMRWQGDRVAPHSDEAFRPGPGKRTFHRLIHEGRPVESGEKLVLRNDVVGTRSAER